MQGYNGRGRVYRTRADSREAEPRKDWVATALTAQIVLCLIIAASLLFMKTLDDSKYIGIKRQYEAMLGDSTQIARTVEFFNEKGQGFAGFFAGTKELFIGKTPGGDKNTEEVVPEARSAPEEAEAAIVNPIEDMQFDYLKDTSETEGKLYLSAGGGVLPMKSGGQTVLPAQGPAFSPIYLSMRMKPPITGVITSGFSYREHPLTGSEDFHTGLDIAAVEGTPILAALPGEVIEVGESEIYGKYIVLQHATNLRTSYSHCSEIIANEGMAVRQGESIALVGETGVATGPHLHFSVIIEDEFADPSLVLQDYIKLVDE